MPVPGDLELVTGLVVVGASLDDAGTESYDLVVKRINTVPEGLFVHGRAVRRRPDGHGLGYLLWPPQLLLEQGITALGVGVVSKLELGGDGAAEQGGSEHHRADDDRHPDADGPPGVCRAGARQAFRREVQFRVSVSSYGNPGPDSKPHRGWPCLLICVVPRPE